MSYENPQVPHEVNVGRESAVREFLRLAAGLALLVVAASAVLWAAGGSLARFVPFERERAWVGDSVVGVATSAPRTPRDREVARYVEELTRDLAARMELPAGMSIRVHFTDDDVPNAFATLGGHIVLTGGLYRRMPSENALAMVIAHEIGHVKARDPIASIGGTAGVALLLALLSGEVSGIVPYVAQTVQRGYSRRAESLADGEALVALRRLYGHAGGAAEVFRVLSKAAGPVAGATPTMLSTHPADAQRIARLEAAAADWDRAKSPLRALRVAPALPQSAL